MPAKYRVEITKTAEADVEDVWRYIATDSPENAARFVMRIEDKIGNA